MHAGLASKAFFRSTSIPGCPPNPAAIMEALLMFLERAPQRVRGGRLSGQ